MRECAETFTDVGSNLPEGYEGFSADDGNDMEIPMMYSQGIDMLSDDIMGTRPDRSTEGRTGSSGSKRKQGGQAVETMEIIRNVMEHSNDRLKAIVEWSNVQRQDASTRLVEVVRQLQRILELSRYDRVCSMQILMCNVDDMKAFLDILDELKLDYCTIIFQDNA
uniref:Retrotransposon protein n=1 Tax=Cucumis melo TaxID=3656 RepID=A0A9I9DDJ0_CUCME